MPRLLVVALIAAILVILLTFASILIGSTKTGRDFKFSLAYPIYGLARLSLPTVIYTLSESEN